MHPATLREISMKGNYSDFLHEPDCEPSRFAAHGSLPKLRTCRNRLPLPTRCGRGPSAVRRRGFMVPMHARRRKATLHEPRSSGRESAHLSFEKFEPTHVGCYGFEAEDRCPLP